MRNLGYSVIRGDTEVIYVKTEVNPEQGNQRNGNWIKRVNSRFNYKRYKYRD